VPLRGYSCFLLIFILLFVTGCHHPNIKVNSSKNIHLSPTVLLISIDGFRFDYIGKTDTPNLHYLAKSGVKSQALIPSFPSKTFPNHYSIITGLFPEHHGIIFNRMFDPDLNAYFDRQAPKTTQDSRWWGGEPLWVTARKQGQISATCFWPGSEVEIQGLHPNYWLPYDANLPNPKRVEQILSWLDLPTEKRPTFITLYFENVDTVGHYFGPDSPELIAAIQEVDKDLGLLLNGLSNRNVLDNINIIVVSDHGMAKISSDKTIFIDDYLDLSKVEIIGDSPIIGIIPRLINEEEIYKTLVKVNPHLEVYKKDSIPEKFHFQNNSRIPPIVCIADEGWSICSKSFCDVSDKGLIQGTHGYDPELSSMQGIFIAHGPAFKTGIVVPAFQNVEIYNLMASILGLKPAPNDGNFDSVNNLLKR
jgi:predicted AlkP superfamily pyrophosphatase or phosphodiesterase